MILRTIGAQSDPILIPLQEQFGDEYYYSWNSFRNDVWAMQAFTKALVDDKDVMCAETPLIGRKLFNDGDPNTYYRIGLNIVSTWLEHNFFIPKETKRERIVEMLKNCKQELQPWRTDGNHIIYAMQVPRDSSLLGLDIFAAAQYDLMFLRQITRRPIIVSVHPDLKKGWGQNELRQSQQYIEGFNTMAQALGVQVTETPATDLLKNAWCTVCHTSGFGFESIINGVPVIALSNRNFISDLASNNYYDVENPPTPDRMPVLEKLAYTQWTAQEVIDGTFKEHVNNIRR